MQIPCEFPGDTSSIDVCEPSERSQHFDSHCLVQRHIRSEHGESQIRVRESQVGRERATISQSGGVCDGRGAIGGGPRVIREGVVLFGCVR